MCRHYFINVTYGYKVLIILYKLKIKIAFELQTAFLYFITLGDIRASLALTLDPRIHFALNCGAKSCPPIRVYSTPNLDSQLNRASASFLCADQGSIEYIIFITLFVICKEICSNNLQNITLVSTF